MKLQTYSLVVAILFVFAINISYAHGGKKDRKEIRDTISIASEQEVNVVQSGVDSSLPKHQLPDADLRFPTFHPLVVHFPIVLILVATVFFWLSFFVHKVPLVWAGWITLVFGYIGAYAASAWFHPHTELLPALAQQILVEHEPIGVSYIFENYLICAVL